MPIGAGAVGVGFFYGAGHCAAGAAAACFFCPIVFFDG